MHDIRFDVCDKYRGSGHGVSEMVTIHALGLALAAAGRPG
jgi:hypothetical protein